MKNKIIWFLGRKFPKFKLWYYKKTGKWLWGIVHWIKLFGIIESKEQPIRNWFKDEEEFNSIIEEIFKFKR